MIILCHGGPIAMPADAEFILQNAEHCHGFYGASSMERLPVEIALTEQTKKFKAIAFAPSEGAAWPAIYDKGGWRDERRIRHRQ